MRRRRRQSIGCLLVWLFVGVASSLTAQADTKAVPEFDLFITHNSTLRSRMVVGATWTKSDSDFTHATFEYDLDIGLWSYFRRYVFKDPNIEKSKRVSFRLGLAKFPDLTTEDATADEKRALAEVTVRFPLGKTWLLADRNRGELRRIGDVDWGRYRNRLRLERNFLIGSFRMTPYLNAEAYYDGKVKKWNQGDTTCGAEFPWYYKTILEIYFTWQFRLDATDAQIVGLTLQKHI